MSYCCLDFLTVRAVNDYLILKKFQLVFFQVGHTKIFSDEGEMHLLFLGFPH